MTRIVHATTVHVRGDTRIAVKEVAALARRFGDVVLFVQDGRGDGHTSGGVRIVDTGPPPTPRLARMSIGVWRMARAVAAARPRIAHIHDPELIPAALWWKLRGIRVVYDAHEDLPRQVLSKPYLPRLLRRPLARLTALAERVVAAACDGVVAATPVIAARFPRDRTALVQNFPDLDELSFEASRPHSERPAQILYLGGLTTIRGIEAMVRAMALVRTPQARLRLAGDFQPRDLEARVSALEGWNRVDHLGWANRDEVRRLLAEARAGLVVLRPVRNYVESQPVKMFEYMAAGLPVIASDFPLWRTLIEEYRCALFVDPEDPAAIAKAVDWVLDNPDAAREMGARGRQAVEQRFNWGREAEALAALYSRIGAGHLEEP